MNENNFEDDLEEPEPDENIEDIEDENFEEEKPEETNTNQIYNKLTNNSREEKINNLINNNDNNENKQTKKSNTYKSLEKNKNDKENKNKFNKEQKEDENTQINKDHIINILLNTEVLTKSDMEKKEISIEKNKKTIQEIKTKKKYKHIESKYKKENLENDLNYKGGPEKFYINADFENPEFKSDVKNAQRKILHNSKNITECEKDKLIRKLLFQDIEKKKKIIEVDKVTNSEIKYKVTYYLNKKQKKLDEIETEKDNEMLKNCTFKPEMIAEKLFPEKRDLKMFLADQNNHLKKVNDKLEKVIFKKIIFAVIEFYYLKII